MHVFNPSIWKGEAGGTLEASLNYRTSPTTARTAQRNRCFCHPLALAECLVQNHLPVLASSFQHSCSSQRLEPNPGLAWPLVHFLMSHTVSVAIPVYNELNKWTLKTLTGTGCRRLALRSWGLETAHTGTLQVWQETWHFPCPWMIYYAFHFFPVHLTVLSENDGWLMRTYKQFTTTHKDVKFMFMGRRGDIMKGPKDCVIKRDTNKYSYYWARFTFRTQTWEEIEEGSKLGLRQHWRAADIFTEDYISVYFSKEWRWSQWCLFLSP